MKKKILDLTPASRVIDLLAVDTDQYAGNFERDLVDHLEEKGYEFIPIEDPISLHSRTSTIIESPAGTQATSLGLCYEDETDVQALQTEIRKFFANYEYRHPHNRDEKVVTVTGFRVLKARVIVTY